MISKSLIEEITRKHQTTQVNVAREYCQHLFLSLFYQKKKSDHILFKGGTAIRFLYNTPRFSEDLDFTAYNISVKQIESILIDTLDDLAHLGINLEMEEAKVTSGGYLAVIRLSFLGFKENIQVNISLRPRKTKLSSDVVLINSDYIPPYNIVSLAEKDLMEEKIQALLDRSRPRDYFDIYYLLRTKLSTPKKKLFLKKILERLEKTRIDFKRELALFLPKSHHHILKDFKKTLRKELKKYI